MNTDTVEAGLRALADQYARSKCGPAVRVLRVVVETADTLDAVAGSERRTAEVQVRRALRQSDLLRADIRAVLLAAGRPLKGAAIARRLGRGHTGHMKQTLADMRVAGLLVGTDEGYALPPQAELPTAV